MVRRRIRHLVAVALAVTSILASTGTASADLWGPRSSGTDTYWDSATSDVLGSGYVSSGNIVGFWQGFLKAYNTIPNCGSYHGYFDYNTVVGTQSIQNFFGLYPDGVVGPATWDWASQWVYSPGTDGFFEYWRPSYAADPYAVLYSQQIASGTFEGYWWWSSPWVNPANTTMNTSLSGPSFGSVC